jgi:hypothetical protein
MPRVLIVIQTSDDCFSNPFRLIGATNWDRNDASFFSRIVVSTGEQGIAYEDHLFQ